MRQQRAFTLIELLVVFSILGLLVALVGPLGARQMDKARAQEQWLVLQRKGLEWVIAASGTEELSPPAPWVWQPARDQPARMIPHLIRMAA